MRELCSKTTMPELWAWCSGDVTKIRAGNMKEWMPVIDPEKNPVITKAVEEIARVVTNASTILMPDAVAFYGTMFSYSPVSQKFISCCKEYAASTSDNYIVASPLADRFTYIGAAAVAVNEFFFNEPR